MKIKYTGPTPTVDGATGLLWQPGEVHDVEDPEKAERLLTNPAFEPVDESESHEIVDEPEWGMDESDDY